VNARALFLVALVVCAPSFAQSADAPLCQPGDVILKPDVAVATAKRLASAEAKVAVYESHPPLPAWGVVLLVLGGVAIGAASTAIVATVAKGK
jgi:hypothetical protein